MARAAANMQQWAATSGDPTARRVFAGSGALCLGQRAAFDAWEAMTRAETKMGQYRKSRDVPMSLLEQYETAARISPGHAAEQSASRLRGSTSSGRP